MPVQNFNVIESSYSVGKEYVIWSCDNIEIKARVLGGVKDDCKIETVIKLVNIENSSQLGLTIIKDSSGKEYYALVKISQFTHPIEGVLRGYFSDVCDSNMMEFANKLQIGTVSSNQIKMSFKTCLLNVKEYIKDSGLRDFIDYIIKFQSNGSPYLMSYVKNTEIYFILVSDVNLDY